MKGYLFQTVKLILHDSVHLWWELWQPALPAAGVALGWSLALQGHCCISLTRGGVKKNRSLRRGNCRVQIDTQGLVLPSAADQLTKTSSWPNNCFISNLMLCTKQMSKHMIRTNRCPRGTHVSLSPLIFTLRSSAAKVHVVFRHKKQWKTFTTISIREDPGHQTSMNQDASLDWMHWFRRNAAQCFSVKLLCLDKFKSRCAVFPQFRIHSL